MKKNVFLPLLFAVAVIGSASAQTWNLTGNNNATATSILGTTNAVNLRLHTRNLPRLVIDSNGKVGIGISNPVNQFTVRSSGGTPASIWLPYGNPVFVGFGEGGGSNADFDLMMASDTYNTSGGFIFKRARGSLNAPTAVQSNDLLGTLVSNGYDGAAFRGAASVDFFVDGAPTSGNVPTRISFSTGSNSSKLERLKVGSTGNFNFNNTQLVLTQSTGDLNLGSGNFLMGSPLKTVQFAIPVVGSAPMMTMFPSGTQNPDRMVIAHSSPYTNWGLQYQDTLDKFNFLGNGVPVLSANLGSQRVGIGTSSPVVKLDVAGTGAYDLFNSDGDIRLGNSTYRLKMGVALGGGGAGDSYISSSNRLYLGTGNAFNRTQTLCINSNGTVGVGTYTPAARFQVIGDTGITTHIISAVTSYVGSADVIGMSSTSKPADGYGYGFYGTGGYMGGRFIGNSGAYAYTGYGIYASASGTAGTRIGVYGSASGGTIDNWGGYFPTKTYTSELRVGGTKGASGYVAAINGKLIATEVRVEAIASWPDYVFSKEHKLLPIEDLETKINADKHLPGIPSAGEVKEGGILLGAMQTKTIEKVEENTLYIIQLNNKIKQLEKIIDELAKKVK